MELTKVIVFRSTSYISSRFRTDTDHFSRSWVPSANGVNENPEFNAFPGLNAAERAAYSAGFSPGSLNTKI